MQQCDIHGCTLHSISTYDTEGNIVAEIPEVPGIQYIRQVNWVSGRSIFTYHVSASERVVSGRHKLAYSSL